MPRAPHRGASQRADDGVRIGEGGRVGNGRPDAMIAGSSPATSESSSVHTAAAPRGGAPGRRPLMREAVLADRVEGNVMSAPDARSAAVTARLSASVTARRRHRSDDAPPPRAPDQRLRAHGPTASSRCARRSPASSGTGMRGVQHDRAGGPVAGTLWARRRRCRSAGAAAAPCAMPSAGPAATTSSTGPRCSDAGGRLESQGAALAPQRLADQPARVDRGEPRIEARPGRRVRSIAVSFSLTMDACAARRYIIAPCRRIISRANPSSSHHPRPQPPDSWKPGAG